MHHQNIAIRDALSSFRVNRREEYLNERVAPTVINFQDRSHVATAITIVRCAKYSNNLLFLHQGIIVIIHIIFFYQREKDYYLVSIWKSNITCAQLNPSMTSWWALAINFKLFVWLNCSDMSCKQNPTVKIDNWRISAITIKNIDES